jgi:lipoprotein-anchoring transpeptidase ErfK/SrfK
MRKWSVGLWRNLVLKLFRISFVVDGRKLGPPGRNVFKRRSLEKMMRIDISVAAQSLKLFDDAGLLLREYQISSAAKGVGEQAGSYQTPRGRHRIRARIGDGLPLGAVLRGRRPTGEICTPELMLAQPDRDWILTRILWLCGDEPGKNRGGQVDTMRRYVYIHGTPDSAVLGVPGSHGCIRMRNTDMVDLFDRVPVGTPVNISED